MHRFTVLGAAIAALAISTATVSAMDFKLEWTLAGDRQIAATGEIMSGDVERLIAMMNDYLATDPPQHHPEVHLNSPGGDPEEAMRVGFVIRDLGLPTVVADGAMCASACTFMFISGAVRRIEGEQSFLIHSVSMADPEGLGTDGVRVATNTVQAVGSALISYERTMLGTTEMTEAALTIPSETIVALDDAHLRDWNIITTAWRDAQHYSVAAGPLSNCGDFTWMLDPDTGVARWALCSADLRIARLSIAIETALQQLSESPMAVQVNEEQGLFESSWQQRCSAGKYATQPGWREDVGSCVRATFAVRLAELEALTAYYAARRSDLAADWTQ